MKGLRARLRRTDYLLRVVIGMFGLIIVIETLVIGQHLHGQG